MPMTLQMPLASLWSQIEGDLIIWVPIAFFGIIAYLLWRTVQLMPRVKPPEIVFIDELDAVGTARTGGGFNREQDQTLNQLLVELDGFDERAQVVVMGASNRIQDLDPALLRPGRFDRQLLVSAPDLAGREEILRAHTRGKPLATDVDLHTVARQTAGLTGADLA